MKGLGWLAAAVVVLIVLRPKVSPMKPSDIRPIPLHTLPRRIEVDPSGVPFID